MTTFKQAEDAYNKLYDPYSDRCPGCYAEDSFDCYPEFDEYGDECGEVVFCVYCKYEPRDN